MILDNWSFQEPPSSVFTFYWHSTSKHITDIKPITARQCIKLLPMIASYKPELKTDILSALYNANISIYADSMQLLVFKDIQKALKEIQKL